MASERPQVGDMVHYFETVQFKVKETLGPFAAIVTEVCGGDDEDDHRVHLTVFRVSRFTGELVSGEEFVPREGHDPRSSRWWRPR